MRDWKVEVIDFRGRLIVCIIHEITSCKHLRGVPTTWRRPGVVTTRQLNECFYRGDESTTIAYTNTTLLRIQKLIVSKVASSLSCSETGSIYSFLAACQSSRINRALFSSLGVISHSNVSGIHTNP